MRDIIGYEGLYAVTSCGKVWSHRSKKFLKPIYDRDGYTSVTIYDKNRKGKDVKVHRIVGLTYIPNPDNLPEINHKDEIKDNNCINNLEWCTRSYNVNYGTRNARVAAKNSS